MILYTGPTSPFARMARVVSLELGSTVEERVIDVYTADFLGGINPLRQIPTLVTGEGEPIYDSRVICRYLDAESGRATLLPQHRRWAVETRWALAVGVMEAGLLRRMEIARADGEKSPAFVAKMEARIDRAIDRIEAESAQFRDAGIRMDAIAIGVALEYTDFRYTADWRLRCPALKAWLDEFARRPSMLQTRPQDPR
jgi:glutathione S-transferase